MRRLIQHPWAIPGMKPFISIDACFLNIGLNAWACPPVLCRFNLLQTLLLAVITGTLFLRGHIPTDTIQVGGAGQPARDALQLCF